ncbi:hypothetical protein BT96DRAFT_1005543 [Gymnopus androsaceus JB14]|uniref:Uncharacterized protein n=1 Tax=Gymnopus androsaceus JB14 TaxID=1447944 RepID=A0A6A4GP84_9AGAR|nr:hypothetical protein BT96DRAFT_1005543 [Gymnopus androsaceus JB14]
MNHVDPIKVMQKVVQGVYQGVTTVELNICTMHFYSCPSHLTLPAFQNLAAETAAYLTTKYPDYACRPYRCLKSTQGDKKELFTDLYGYIDPKTGKPASMVSEETY